MPDQLDAEMAARPAVAKIQEPPLVFPPVLEQRIAACQSSREMSELVLFSMEASTDPSLFDPQSQDLILAAYKAHYHWMIYGRMVYKVDPDVAKTLEDGEPYGPRDTWKRTMFVVKFDKPVRYNSPMDRDKQCEYCLGAYVAWDKEKQRLFVIEIPLLDLPGEAPDSAILPAYSFAYDDFERIADFAGRSNLAFIFWNIMNCIQNPKLSKIKQVPFSMSSHLARQRTAQARANRLLYLSEDGKMLFDKKIQKLMAGPRFHDEQAKKEELEIAKQPPREVAFHHVDEGYGRYWVVAPEPDEETYGQRISPTTGKCLYLVQRLRTAYYRGNPDKLGKNTSFHVLPFEQLEKG